MTDKGTAMHSRTTPPTPSLELSRQEKAVVCTLLYYHIFRFPLKADEILRFSRCGFADSTDVGLQIDKLLERGLVKRRSPYYFVGEPGDVDDRIEAEARALKTMPRALSRSRLIARFPFVRAVAITGTLSKGVMKAGDDLDFMVFTEPGRLWIARFLLMTFKKVFLLNSHRSFCINYLLSTNKLPIPDHDLFTATEIAWMLPTSNSTIYERFIEENRWVRSFFPNWRRPPVDRVAAPPSSLVQKAVECVLNALGGDRLDTVCQSLITRRNRRKYAALNGSTFDSALRAEKHASKHHPRAFRDRTLSSYAGNLGAFEHEHGTTLGKPELLWD